MPKRNNGKIVLDEEMMRAIFEEVARESVETVEEENAAAEAQKLAFGETDGVCVYPAIPMRGPVPFPGEQFSFEIERKASGRAVQKSISEKTKLIVLPQKSENEICKDPDDFYGYGLLCEVNGMDHFPGHMNMCNVTVTERLCLTGLLRTEPYLVAEARILEDKTDCDELHLAAGMNAIRDVIEDIFGELSQIPDDIRNKLENCNDPVRQMNLAAMYLVNDTVRQVKILSTNPIGSRQIATLSALDYSLEVTKLENAIRERVTSEMSEEEKQYQLRMRLKAIHEEMGDDAADADTYREKLAGLPVNAETRDKIAREITKFSQMMPGTPENSVSANYIEWVLALPWNKRVKSKIDLARAEKVLEEDHYGLKEVKERVLEYLAVRSLKGDMQGPCICLVGPPGVGKTSVAKSIARALKRPLAHVSLGGVHDEAEIRGHRRTYLGAMPGRIMSAIRQADCMNPVFLLDEIDKMASDYKGDPSSAMLEVLDGEQNNAFRDHYLDIPFDLSEVMFITTANNRDAIPAPLLDRMEIIEIEGYTANEKLAIAKEHLVAKELEANGIGKKNLRFKDDALERIIEEYTREAGVRQLQRQIGKVCRKAACAVAKDPETPKAVVGKDELPAYLGAPKYLRLSPDKGREVGIVNGLAWTQVGGETLPVEVAVMPGSGKLELTGSLGDVMRESAKAAYTLVRVRAQALGITEEFHKTKDVHIHFPDGATPKDGPSAGVTITCALASALTERPARQDVAMTGEINLRGKVQPIGGVKEKVLAAHRAGMKIVLLPPENKPDLEKIPEEVRSALDIRLISTVEDAMAIVLAPEKAEG